MTRQPPHLFTHNDDLPIFSGTCMRAPYAIFHPQPAHRQPHLPGMAPTYSELATAHMTRRTHTLMAAIDLELDYPEPTAD